VFSTDTHTCIRIYIHAYIHTYIHTLCMYHTYIYDIGHAPERKYYVFNNEIPTASRTQSKILKSQCIFLTFMYSVYSSFKSLSLPSPPTVLRLILNVDACRLAAQSATRNPPTPPLQSFSIPLLPLTYGADPLHPVPSGLAHTPVCVASAKKPLRCRRSL
jgi:hypothetical protein